MAKISESRQRQIIDKCEDLFDETIMGALSEDFEFKNTTEVKTAINSLITHLKSINVESLVNDED